MSQTTQTIRARWIIPVDRPPIENGTISVQGGRIVSLGHDVESVASLDLGDALIFPQFVNAHTHLEFAGCETPFGPPRASFASWIQRVIVSRREIPAAEMARAKQLAIRTGLEESQSSAVCAVGEISTLPWSRENYLHASVSPVVFHECLGLAAREIPAAIQRLEEILARERASPDGLRLGISPHAPYSTHTELVAHLVEVAIRERLPVAMHLAESREELELLNSKRGPLRELLDDLGVWHDDAIRSGIRILDYLRLLAKNARSLIVHGNYLSGHEMDFVARHRDRMHVVYCPRTHAFFGHEPYPLVEYLNRGISVSVATDSRASNPDLRMGAEIAFAAKSSPIIPPEQWLRMVTLHPAAALGLESQFGSISPGKSTRLALIDLPSGAPEDPYELWLNGIEMARPLKL